MICQPCKEGRPEDQCLGFTKHKTWCDSQHKPKGIILDSAQCKHVNRTDSYCDLCGKEFNAPTDRDSGELPTLSAEDKRDIEDNFVTDKR